MPIFLEKIEAEFSLFIWEIKESYEEMREGLELRKRSLQRLEDMKRDLHKLQFLASRQIINYVNLTDWDIVYKEDGRPYLKTGEYISISHSNNFTALVISQNMVGVDIETNFDKVMRVRSKFLNFQEVKIFSTEEEIVSAWCIKESIYKLLEKKCPLPKINVFERNYKSYVEQLENICICVCWKVEK